MTGSATQQTAAATRLPPSRLMTAYSAVLALGCGVIVATGFPSSYLQDGLFWIPLIAVANLTTLSILPEVDVESPLGPIVIAAAAVLYPPAAVTLFACVGALFWREVLGEAPLVMAVFNRAMYGLAGAASAGAVEAVYALLGSGSWQIVPAALVAVVCFDAVNTVLLAVMLVVRRGRSWRQAVSESANPFPRFTLNAAVSAMMSLLIVVLVRDVSRWSVVLVAVPFWLSHSAQRSARIAQDRTEQLTARVRELEMLNRLSGELLTVHDAGEVAPVATKILDRALDGGVLAVDLDGTTSDGIRVEIPGAAPAAIVLSGHAEHPGAVVEAAASLIGLTLTRLQVEAELAETERARTALTARILEEATHERSRIAMEVHDDVLPLFAAAQMQIDNADMLIEIDDPVRASEVVEKATGAVSDGIRALRDTLESLRQSTLVPGTVTEGVRRLLADVQARTGVRATFEAPDTMPELPFAVELLAYETVRGSLANVEKHAAASSVHVDFRHEGDRLVVLMRDDGRGFDPTKVGMRSHGVALMRQRAELARGSFDITGTPDKGTTVRLEVPTW
ncbi:MAG TPA: sensor histidine kinase [Euzebyales bacterium]|nr:sensor histidine kinase [Euzebyales bacterium]